MLLESSIADREGLVDVVTRHPAVVHVGDLKPPCGDIVERGGGLRIERPEERAAS